MSSAPPPAGHPGAAPGHPRRPGHPAGTSATPGDPGRPAAPAGPPVVPTPPLPRRVVVLPAVLTWLVAACTTAAYLALGAVLESARLGTTPSAAALVVLVVAALGLALSAYAGPRLSLGAVGPREDERRDVLLDQLFRLGVAYRTQERSGRFVSTATDGVERAANYEATFRWPILASMTVPVVALVGLGVAVDPVIALWLAVALPGIPLLVGGFQKLFRGVSGRYRVTSRRFAAQYLDAIQGLPTATAFGRARAKGAELARSAEELRRQVMRLLAGNQLVLLVIDSSFSLLMVTSAAGLAMVRLRDGAITPGQAVAVVLISTVLLEPLDRVGQFFYIGMGGRAAVREIDTVLAQHAAVEDAPGVRVPAGADPDEALALDRVDFAYPGGAPVLHQVSFTVPVGGRVALIGPSGSGKSTVAALVQAQLRPTAGMVRVAGHDATTVPTDWVRAQTAVVAQSTYLFTGSLADNLRLADPDAGDDLLWHVLAEANLADDVRRFPDGLATRVGERGLSLSGGQAQRLAVARALLKDAPILVLDEPTSQVDAASESALIEALDRAGQGRTVLLVAHRLSTVRGADQVLVLAEGRIVEQGPPDQLGSIDSYYARALDLSGIGGENR
ncbi:ABC transporter ATP-binding protein/permease [Cellulomonas denverensis]|uniref:ABC transporter ATP-binding protein n=1 Tax=Cellulomonas denverensis TaxID=264297 RepID=A0A7X6KVG8_9CELL|nr:ABC transporter ATP-binding protein [Cellulomonas denverensis]NKY23052.1 ABC transporter ATP-binding protein [Cellulomonas denverensis]GIG23867.1 HlyB/MsbA family ABC transporter [Cellulomonas denverensis]